MECPSNEDETQENEDETQENEDETQDNEDETQDNEDETQENEDETQEEEEEDCEEEEGGHVQHDQPSSVPEGWAVYQLSPQKNSTLCMSVQSSTKQGLWLGNDKQVGFDICNDEDSGQLWVLPDLDTMNVEHLDMPLNLLGSNMCLDSGTVYEGNYGPDNASKLKIYECFQDENVS